MKYLVLLFILFFVNPAYAQTHPCDEPDVNTGTVISNTMLVAVFCAKVADNIEAVSVYSNGIAIFFGGLDRVSPDANNDGEALYQSHPFGQFQRGTYNIQIAVYNTSESGAAQVGPLTDPFFLLVVDPSVILPPGAPKLKSIKRP